MQPLKSLQIPTQQIEVADRKFTLRMMAVSARRTYAEHVSAFTTALAAPTEVYRESAQALKEQAFSADGETIVDGDAATRLALLQTAPLSVVTPEQQAAAQGAATALFTIVLRRDGGGNENPPDPEWIVENVLEYPNLPDEILNLQRELNDGGPMGNHLALLVARSPEGMG